MTIVKNMAWIYNKYMISYAPFWRTLKDRGESTYTLINVHKVSSATLDRMRKGGGITTAKLNDFCKILHCRVEDIIEFIEEE